MDSSSELHLRKATSPFYLLLNLLPQLVPELVLVERGLPRLAVEHPGNGALYATPKVLVSRLKKRQNKVLNVEHWYSLNMGGGGSSRLFLLKLCSLHSIIFA